MRNIRPLVVFWIIVGISMVSMASCQTVVISSHRDMVVACIKSGGEWIEGDTTVDSKTRSNKKTIEEGDRCVKS